MSNQDVRKNPPATVLRDAADRKEAPPTFEETGQVRRLPQMPNPPTWRIIFQSIESSGTTIGVDVRDPTTIGRSSSEDDELPGLDLANFSAFKSGVSRQHAVLIPTQEALYLVDMKSRNGTWLNGHFVEPDRRYALNAGDRVEFGLFKLRIRTLTRIDNR